MIIAITGHTRGLGKALHDHLENQGHTVKGYSRSNGFPLSESLEKIVEDAQDADLFINNAHVGVLQARLLIALHDKWRGNPNKKIWTMSSISAQVVLKTIGYSMEKAALDNAVALLTNVAIHPRITNFHVGMIDTPSTKKYDNAKLSIAQFLRVASFVLDNMDIYVKDITFTNTEQKETWRV